MGEVIAILILSTYILLTLASHYYFSKEEVLARANRKIKSKEDCKELQEWMAKARISLNLEKVLEQLLMPEDLDLSYREVAEQRLTGTIRESTIKNLEAGYADLQKIFSIYRNIFIETDHKFRMLYEGLDSQFRNLVEEMTPDKNGLEANEWMSRYRTHRLIYPALRAAIKTYRPRPEKNFSMTLSQIYLDRLKETIHEDLKRLCDARAERLQSGERHKDLKNIFKAFTKRPKKPKKQF